MTWSFEKPQLRLHLLFNEVKENKFKTILNVQTDFRNNILYRYFLDIIN